MKTATLILALALVPAIAAGAAAALCKDCAGMMFTMDIGKCQACGEAKTTSGAHKLCPACSRKLNQCEHCRKLLAAAPADAPKPETKPPAPRADTPKAIATLGAERAKALKGDLGSFIMTVIYHGDQDKPFYGLTLSTRGLRRAATYQFDIATVIDEGTAAKIIDRLAETNVLGRAEDISSPRDGERAAPAGPCYVVCVSGARRSFECDLGWGKELEPRLLGLRALLSGESLKNMDTLLTRLGVKAESPAPARLKTVRENIKDFTLRLDYSGPEDKPFYRLTLTTLSVDVKAAPFHSFVVIDEKQALALVAHIEADGFFNTALDKVNVDPNAPCYILRLKAGSLALEENLGWGESLVKRLRFLKAVLDGPAAEGLDRLLARIGG